jgi:hypothetical protein
MKTNTMKWALALLVLCAASPSYAAAQVDPDIVGREARVWPEGALRPIAGRIATITPMMLSLDTDDMYCGPAGCVRTYTAEWPAISRLQMGRRSSRERVLRIGLVGVGIGLLLGPAMSSCSDGRCAEKVTAISVGVGFAGYFITRQAWDDVALTQ